MTGEPLLGQQIFGRQMRFTIGSSNEKKEENVYDINNIFPGLPTLCELPKGLDQNEWFAYHVFLFHRQVSMLYTTISVFCTSETCPKMSAGSGYRYLWTDDVPAPIEYPAPTYISKLLDSIEKQLGDEAVFPSEGTEFPKEFKSIVKNIFKRLFRVYAHFFYHHLQDFKRLGIKEELNTSFAHFSLFNDAFELVSSSQMEPLSDLIVTIRQNEFQID